MIAYNIRTRQLTEVEHSWMLKPPEDWVANPLIADRAALQAVSSDEWVYETETTVLRPMTALELETDPDRLANAKRERIASMNQAAHREIIGGFWSMAMETPYWYDSTQEDQMNMTSALLASAPSAGYPNGISLFYAFRTTMGGIKEYAPHNYLQLRQIAVDGAMARTTSLQRFYARRQQIDLALTVSDVNLVTWEV